MTVMEMANQKATGIYVFVSQGMSFYTAWKVLSAIDDMTIKPVRGDRDCHAPLECFTMISPKQSPPLQRRQCLCPLEDNLVGNLIGKFLLPPFFQFPFSQQSLNLQRKPETFFRMIYSVTAITLCLFAVTTIIFYAVFMKK